MRNNPLAFVDPTGHAPDAAYWGGLARGFGKTALVAGAVLLGAVLLPAGAVLGVGLALGAIAFTSSFERRAMEQAECDQDVDFWSTAGAAALDTTGLSGLIEGSTGRRMLSGAQLTSEQAGEAMGSSLAALAAWAAGPRVARSGRAQSAPWREEMGVPFAKGTEVDGPVAETNALTNPLPLNGRFATVMPSQYAESLARGTGRLSGGPEAWITAADDLGSIQTIEGAARRLTLVDKNGQLRLGGNAVVEFDIGGSAPIASPYNRPNPGFLTGGRTRGGAREWLLPSDTPIYNVSVRYLR